MNTRRCAIAAVIVGCLYRAAFACETADSSRIAVAGGSLTEIVYFLGAEARIVAVDTTSNFPKSAGDFPSVGYVRALSAEGLLSLNPTLVLGEDDMGPPEVLKQISGAGVAVVRVPETRTAAGIVAKVRCVAAVLDLFDKAEALIAENLSPVVDELMRLRTDARRSQRQAPKVAVLLGIRDGAPVGAGRGTSGDGLLRMAHAESVFADFEGWKPVSMEAMASANPEYIVMPARGVHAAGGGDEVFSHPALGITAAGRAHRKDQRLVVMDGMAMLGFGPRTLTAALELARLLQTEDSGG